jgi:hypothetical protein
VAHFARMGQASKTLEKRPPHVGTIVCEASEPGLVPEATTRIANHAQELHPLRCADTQQAKAVAQNLAGGIVEP